MDIKYRMKQNCTIHTLLALFALSVISYAQTSNNPVLDADINHAIQTLTSTKPMAMPTFQLSLVDVVKRQAAGELYAKQMNALTIIGEAKSPGIATYLIPYLNYSTTDYHGASYNGRPSGPENINETRKHWPALSALINLPDSSSVLSQYALKKENPVRFRFSAFCALKYIDKQQCKIVGDALTEEFSDSQHAPEYIQGVESNKVPFSGAIYSPR